MRMKVVVEHQLRNRSEDIRAVEGWVKSFAADCGLAAQIQRDLDLALTEWLTNVIAYGYTDTEEHWIRVRLACDEHQVKAEVEDDGRRFNPLERPAVDTAVPLEERPAGGLGIHMIRNVMDSLEYRREGPRNVLIMRRRLE